MKKVKLKGLTPSPTMHLALERRDVDALVIWVPALAFPIANGFGYSAPITINNTAIGNINALLAMRTDFIQKGKVAVDMMKAYVAAADHFAKDKAAWMKGAKSLTGMKPNVLEESLKFLIFDTRVYPENLKVLAKNAYKLGDGQEGHQRDRYAVDEPLRPESGPRNVGKPASTGVHSAETTSGVQVSPDICVRRARNTDPSTRDAHVSAA